MENLLLGHLAHFGSFSSQSELLCTQGLGYLLRTYEDARSALAREVETRVGAKIGERLDWQAEANQNDRGRPDLEARTAEGVPVVKVEAKLGAKLEASQSAAVLRRELQIKHEAQTYPPGASRQHMTHHSPNTSSGQGGSTSSKTQGGARS